MAGASKATQEATQGAILDAIRSMPRNELGALLARTGSDERRRRHEEEEARRLSKMTVVRFEASYRNFNQGETAGLVPKEAHEVIAAGIAVRVDGAKPLEEAPRVSDQKRDTERAQVSQVAKFIEALDEDSPSDFDKDGLPSTRRLSTLAGFAVTDEMRDAAWSAFQAAQESRGQ